MNTFITQIINTIPVDANNLINYMKGSPVLENTVQAIATRAFALLAMTLAVAGGAKILYNRLNIKSLLSNTLAMTALVIIGLFSYQIFNLSLTGSVDKTLFMNAAFNAQTIITNALIKFIDANF